LLKQQFSHIATETMWSGKIIVWRKSNA